MIKKLLNKNLKQELKDICDHLKEIKKFLNQKSFINSDTLDLRNKRLRQELDDMLT